MCLSADLLGAASTRIFYGNTKGRRRRNPISTDAFLYTEIPKPISERHHSDQTDTSR